MRTFWKWALVLVIVFAIGALLLAVNEVTFISPPAGMQIVAPYADPARIVIPAIRVDAPVVPVGLDQKGNMGVPGNQFDVAWYKLGSRPGMPGSAVMAGHLDTKLTPEAVFYDLDKLQVGDEVQVRDTDGKTVTFRVFEKKRYPYDARAEEVFAMDTPSRLNLITCGGVWLKDKKVYSERIVVFTEKA